MTVSAVAGPNVSYGSRQNPAEGGSNNVDQGPGSSVGGTNLFDLRAGYNATTKGWIGQGVEYWRCLSATPAALGTAKVAALANVVSGTAMTLAVASTGVTVLSAALTLPNGKVIPSGCLVLDGNPAVFNYGLADSNGLYKNHAWNNSTMVGRAVSITDAASATGGNVLVSGYDTFGFPMSELIAAAAGASTTNGKKAFKFIASVVPQFTDAHNYSVGTLDIFGLPIRADLWDQVLVYWNSALLTANTGFTAAVTTSPATTTTGDVRGTYAVQSASDGTKRLTVAVSPSQSVLGLSTLWGVTQA